jgi:hypothetical protein
MAVTISLYNHTAARFASGANAVGDTYKVKLFTAATFDATHTTETAAGGTEVSNTGYTAGGATLANVSVTTVATNDAMFDADDVSWTATGAAIEASYARIYNSADSAPVAFIDFGGTETAASGTDFKLIWNASGILSFTVA